MASGNITNMVTQAVSQLRLGPHVHSYFLNRGFPSFVLKKKVFIDANENTNTTEVQIQACQTPGYNPKAKLGVGLILQTEFLSILRQAKIFPKICLQ